MWLFLGSQVFCTGGCCDGFGTLGWARLPVQAVYTNCLCAHLSQVCTFLRALRGPLPYLPVNQFGMSVLTFCALNHCVLGQHMNFFLQNHTITDRPALRAPRGVVCRNTYCAVSHAARALQHRTHGFAVHARCTAARLHLPLLAPLLRRTTGVLHALPPPLPTSLFTPRGSIVGT